MFATVGSHGFVGALHLCILQRIVEKNPSSLMGAPMQQNLLITYKLSDSLFFLHLLLVIFVQYYK